MKKHQSFVFIFALIGCASISFEPVTHPDQRIQLGGFSFLPPNGDNWEVASYPLEQNLTWKTWGRSTWKRKAFRKNYEGSKQVNAETEAASVGLNIYEFAIRKFDNDDDLMELAQIGSKILDKRGMELLESSYSHEKNNGMNCVRGKWKAKGGLRISYTEAFAVIDYFQGYVCVHPRSPKHVLDIRAIQSVLKGQAPIDIQSELDHFFNSLQVH